jgi:hypothetical protein
VRQGDRWSDYTRAPLTVVCHRQPIYGLPRLCSRLIGPVIPNACSGKGSARRHNSLCGNGRLKAAVKDGSYIVEFRYAWDRVAALRSPLVRSVATSVLAGTNIEAWAAENRRTPKKAIELAGRARRNLGKMP